MAHNVILKSAQYNKKRMWKLIYKKDDQTEDLLRAVGEAIWSEKRKQWYLPGNCNIEDLNERYTGQLKFKKYKKGLIEKLGSSPKIKSIFSWLIGIIIIGLIVLSIFKIISFRMILGLAYFYLFAIHFPLWLAFAKRDTYLMVRKFSKFGLLLWFGVMFVTVGPLLLHQLVIPLSPLICPCGYQMAEGGFAWRTFDMPGYVAMNEFKVICQGDLGEYLINVLTFLITLFILYLIIEGFVLFLGKKIQKILSESPLLRFRKLILIIVITGILYLISIDPWVTPYIVKKINNKIYNGNTHSLVEATRQGREGLVRQMLDHGGDIFAENERGSTAAGVARDLQLTRMIDIFNEKMAVEPPARAELWNRGIDVTRQSLIVAIQEQNSELVELLIEAGVNPESDKSVCPICAAAGYANPEMIQLLLKYDVNINTRDAFGMTPLELAAKSGKVENLKILIQNGADLKKEIIGSALWQTASYGAISKDKSYLDIIIILLDNGANINSQDRNGMSSLMFAAKDGDTEMVRLLLNYNPDLNLNEFNTGNTAIRLAKKYNHREVVELLRNAGATE